MKLFSFISPSPRAIFVFALVVFLEVFRSPHASGSQNPWRHEVDIRRHDKVAGVVA